MNMHTTIHQHAKTIRSRLMGNQPTVVNRLNDILAQAEARKEQERLDKIAQADAWAKRAVEAVAMTPEERAKEIAERKHQRRLKNETYQLMMSLWSEGMTIKEIASILGNSSTRVSTLVGLYPEDFPARGENAVKEKIDQSRNKTRKLFKDPVVVPIDDDWEKAIEFIEKRKALVSEIVTATLEQIGTAISAHDLIGENRATAIVKIRHHVWYEVRRQRPDLSWSRIGRLFHRDHATIMHGVAQHKKRIGEAK